MPLQRFMLQRTGHRVILEIEGVRPRYKGALLTIKNSGKATSDLNNP